MQIGITEIMPEQQEDILKGNGDYLGNASPLPSFALRDKSPDLYPKKNHMRLVKSCKDMIFLVFYVQEAVIVQYRRFGLALFLVVMISLMVMVCGVSAGDIPSGVTTQEVKAISHVPIGTHVVWRNGIGYYGTTTRLQDGSPVKLGDIAIDADYEYTLTFYNVGALGGTKYQTAVLTRQWVAQGPGELIITRQQELDEAYQKYLAANPKVVVPKPVAPEGELAYKPNPGSRPVFQPETVSDNLVFSGGPDGSFEGTNAKTGSRITLVVAADKKYVTHGPGIDCGELIIQDPEAVWRGWDLVEGDGTDVGARFSASTGQVEVLLPGAKEWKLAKPGMVLLAGTHIKTMEDSSAIISFGDVGPFVLKPESEVVIDTAPGPESKISLVAGNIWANVKKIVKDGSFEMEMNQAVCGIKGTTFVGEVKKDGTSTLKVIEGTVAFTAKADGRTVMVDGGSMVSAGQMGLGTPEKFDTVKENAVWEMVKASASSPSPTTAAGTAPTQKSSPFPLMGIGAVALIIGLAGKNRQ